MSCFLNKLDGLRPKSIMLSTGEMFARCGECLFKAVHFCPYSTSLR